MPRLGCPGLRSYAFVYSALALTASSAPGTLDALAAILRSRCPPDEHPRFSRNAVGYSRTRDALWVRPHQLFATRRSATTSLLNDVDVETAAQIFYEDRTLVPALRILNAQLVSHPPGSLDARSVLKPEEMGWFRAIAGAHAGTTLEYRGPLLVGHDPAQLRGVFWLGVRPDGRGALESASVQNFWLRHGPMVLDRLVDRDLWRWPRGPHPGNLLLDRFESHPALLRPLYRELMHTVANDRGWTLTTGVAADVVVGAGSDHGVRDLTSVYLPFTPKRGFGGTLRAALAPPESTPPAGAIVWTNRQIEDVARALPVELSGVTAPRILHVVGEADVLFLLRWYPEVWTRHKELLHRAISRGDTR